MAPPVRDLSVDCRARRASPRGPLVDRRPGLATERRSIQLELGSTTKCLKRHLISIQLQQDSTPARWVSERGVITPSPLVVCVGLSLVDLRPRPSQPWRHPQPRLGNYHQAGHQHPVGKCPTRTRSVLACLYLSLAALDPRACTHSPLSPFSPAQLRAISAADAPHTTRPVFSAPRQSIAAYPGATPRALPATPANAARRRSLKERTPRQVLAAQRTQPKSARKSMGGNRGVGKDETPSHLLRMLSRSECHSNVDACDGCTGRFGLRAAMRNQHHY